jgi:hypothetical protein
MSTTFPNAQDNAGAATPVWVAVRPGGGATLANFSAATAGTQIKTGAGTLFGLSVNTGASGASVTLYDGTSTAGGKIGTYSATAQGGPTLPLAGIAFATGLFVVIVNAPDVTVSYV